MEIKRLYKTGNYTQKELGLKYGIARSMVGRIVHGLSWKSNFNIGGEAKAWYTIAKE